LGHVDALKELKPEACSQGKLRFNFEQLNEFDGELKSYMFKNYSCIKQNFIT
jgi:hypothetical protein